MSWNETPALIALASASAGRETEALLRLTARANDALRLEDIYEPALDALLELLRVDRASILLFDDDDVMRFKAWRGLSDTYRQTVEGHSPWKRGEKDARPFCTPDVVEDEELRSYHELFRQEGIRALAFIPLVSRGELLGKFMAYSAKARVFSEHELALGQAIAAQVAQACARAQLIEAERASRDLAERSADRMRRLLRTTARLSNALYADEIGATAIDQGTLTMGCRTAGLWVLEGSTLRLLRQRGLPDMAVPRMARVELSDDMPISRACRTCEPVWLESRAAYAAAFPQFAEETQQYPGRTGELALAAFPLTIQGRAIGALGMAFEGARMFDDAERVYVSVLAQHCAEGLERARLYREAQAAEERARLLAQISELLATSLDTEMTMHNVAEFTVPRMADFCIVELASRSIPMVIKHVDPTKVELARAVRERYRSPEDSPRGVRQVMRTGKPEIYVLRGDVEPPDPAARAQLAAARELGLRSVMIVPMRAHGQNFGAITFVAAESERTFGAADLALATQIGERAGVALHNASLYQQAITAVRVRDEFLSVAGHELRTPLTALLLQAQSLLRSLSDVPDAAKARQRAERLTRNAGRLSGLVDELLDVTRITSGRLTLDVERLELNALLHDVLSASQEQIERARSPVRLTESGRVVGSWDRHRLEQVVLNLLSNALKYGSEKPIDIALGSDGDEAVLRVRDHGIGISAEDQQRIFGRFERAVSSRNFGGLGLGLWIARQIVEAHGGTIGVWSERENGAEFTVRLPLRAREASDLGPASQQ